MTYADPHSIFCFGSGFWLERPRQSRRVLPRVHRRSFVFVFRFLRLFKQVKGWRRFSRSRTLGRRLSDLSTAEPMSAKREPRVQEAKAPGRCGKRQADRSDVRQEFARKRPEPVSSLWTSGRAPALHAASVSQPLPFDASLPFCPCEANAAAFRRARDNAFHPATGSLSHDSECL